MTTQPTEVAKTPEPAVSTPAEVMPQTTMAQDSDEEDVKQDQPEIQTIEMEQLGDFETYDKIRDNIWNAVLRKVKPFCKADDIAKKLVMRFEISLYETFKS